MGSILGLILLKPPRAVIISGPPPEWRGALPIFARKVSGCVATSLRSMCAKFTGCATWLGFKNWVVIGRFGPRCLQKMPLSLGPPPRWFCRNFKSICPGGSAIGLVQHGRPQQPKFSYQHCMGGGPVKVNKTCGCRGFQAMGGKRARGESRFWVNFKS